MQSTRRAHLRYAIIPLSLFVACSAPSGEMVDAGSTGDERFVSFQDPDSDFETTDVRDIDGEIMRFEAQSESLVRVDDGLAFTPWPVDGNLLGPTGFFQVRFGTEHGERRAYFTETATETICDLVVESGSLRIFPTSTRVPQE